MNCNVNICYAIPEESDRVATEPRIHVETLLRERDRDRQRAGWTEGHRDRGLF